MQCSEIVMCDRDGTNASSRLSLHPQRFKSIIGSCTASLCTAKSGINIYQSLARARYSLITCYQLSF